MNRHSKTYMINCDALNGRYLDLRDKHGNFLMKNLRRLSESGVRFNACSDILPAVTSGNHAAIMTSASPGVSGLYSAAAYYKGLKNDFDVEVHKYAADDLLVKNLFETYQGHGLKTAYIGGKSWVGKLLSRGCDIMVTGMYEADSTGDEGRISESLGGNRPRNRLENQR